LRNRKLCVLILLSLRPINTWTWPIQYIINGTLASCYLHSSTKHLTLSKTNQIRDSTLCIRITVQKQSGGGMLTKLVTMKHRNLSTFNLGVSVLSEVQLTPLLNHILFSYWPCFKMPYLHIYGHRCIHRYHLKNFWN
jgi:hypothetical protein